MPEPIGPTTAGAATFNYNMADVPTMRKCLLLTFQGICVIGTVDKESAKSYAGWAGLANRDKELERSLGIRIEG